MKNQLSLFSLLTAACLVTSCSHDDQVNDNDGRTALQVTSGIQTRAYDNQWEADDAIGIYMLNESTVEAVNQKYLTPAGGTNGTFAPAATDQAIYFPMDGTTRDFVAYYPHATIAEDHLYAVNIADQTTQKAIDLMGATKVTGKSKNDASVAFVFVHKLSKLVITLKGDGTITDDQLANTVVKVTNQQTAGTYNVVEGGEVTVTPATPAEVALHTTELKAEGILLPNADTKDMLLTFAVPAPIGQTFSWAIKEAPKSQLFEAGKKYLYAITIGKQNLSVSSTVTDWLPGNEGGETGEAE